MRSRLVVARRQHRGTDYQVDGVHVLMGVAMAGMLVPSLRVFWVGGWEVVFGVATAWFGWLTIRERRRQPVSGRSGHHFQHVLACGAMLYMFLAVTGTAAAAAGSGGSGMSGMAGGVAHFPTLALVLALALFAYVVWTAEQAPGAGHRGRAGGARPDPGPALAGAGAGLSGAGTAGAQSVLADADLAPAARKAVPLSPRLAACCEIAMGVTMGYMLILML